MAVGGRAEARNLPTFGLSGFFTTFPCPIPRWWWERRPKMVGAEASTSVPRVFRCWGLVTSPEDGNIDGSVRHARHPPASLRRPTLASSTGASASVPASPKDDGGEASAGVATPRRRLQAAYDTARRGASVGYAARRSEDGRGKARGWLLPRRASSPSAWGRPLRRAGSPWPWPYRNSSIAGGRATL